MTPPERTRPLTHRQVEVLELMAKGMTNPEIGGVLGIGLSTVKTHVSAVIESLGVTNRTEAVGRLAELELGKRHAEDAATAVPGFGARPLLALMPFEHPGARTEDAWFARGLLEDLTQRAGAMRWFPVIQAESTHAVAPENAEELAAHYRVEGSVVREDERLILTLRVRDAAGANVWATSIERPLAAMGELQREAVKRVVQELEPAVLRLEQVRVQRERADRIVVWDLCKRAEYELEAEDPGGYRRSVALFEEAIAVERDSARAWAGLALAHTAALYLGLVEDLRTTAGAAHAAATRAIELAPGEPETELAMGRTLALSLEDAAALPHLEKALEVDPSSSLCANTLAGALRRQGRFAEAIPYYQRSIRLSPRSRNLYHVYGGLSLAHLSAGDYEASLEWATRATRGDSADGRGKALDFYPVIPASLALLGRIDEARSAWAHAGEHISRPRMRHGARFTGQGLEALVEGLRLAGWDGRLDP